MKQIIILCLSLVLVCCKNASNKETEHPECLCPHATICLQPYEDFSKEEIERFLPVLQEKLEENVYGSWEFKINDPIVFPKHSYISSMNRYKGISLLNNLKSNSKDTVIIGLTHGDICADVHNKKNYGIVGYSYMNKNVSVVSDKRLKDKRMIWKSIIHEFMHSFFGKPHCPNDDPKCFLKDAKGKGNFEIQDYLCNSCRM